jgi:phage-related protein
MWPAVQQALPGFEHLGAVIVTDVVPAIAKMRTMGLQFTKDVLPYFIEGFEYLSPILVKVGGFIADNLGKAIAFVTPDVVSATGAIEQFAVGIEQRAAPFVRMIAKDIELFLKWIGPYWPSIWNDISSTFEGAWKVISGTVQIGFSLIKGIINVGMDLLSGDWGKAWNDVKDTFSGVWEGVKTVAGGVWEQIGWGVRIGVNGIVDGINTVIGVLDGIQIHIPAIGVGSFKTPAFDWDGLGIPMIPHMAMGGFAAPGSLFVAGEEGEELIQAGPSGASVMSHNQSLAALAAARGSGGGGEIHVHNHIYLDSQEITDMLGGNLVQRWLGHGSVKTLRSVAA